MRIKTIGTNYVVVFQDNLDQILFSYDTKIATIDSCDIVTLTKQYRASRTTMKHLIDFLGVESIKTVDVKLKNGTYYMEDN